MTPLDDTMLSLTVAFALAVPAQPAGHEAANPLYKAMLDPGLSVGPDVRTKLPTPLMPDGLDADKQKAIITELIGNDYSYENFTRKSPVAPQVLRIRDARPADPKAPVRGLDTYFVAYVDLKAFEDEKLLDRSLNSGKGDGKGKKVTRDDLAKRGIVFKPEDEKLDGYGHVEFDFLEKVRLRLTGHAVTTKTPESVLSAAEIDPRFRGDKEFPNEWQALTKENGEVKAGPPQPYGGAGLYVKITKLAEPAGAVFVEQHVVFAEPTGWFDGANLLRSKLPPAVQISVRRMREAWMKAGK